MVRVIVRCVVMVCLLALLSQDIRAEDRALHSFKRQELTSEYYSEGANAGDLNKDGKPDIVSGPYWYAGPDFKTKREIYRPVPQRRQGYADNFFSWVYDFNDDGWNDVFVVGFPGTPAYVYENPKDAASEKHWTKHQVFDWVSNESPQFTDIDGDGKPELICTRDGRFGYAKISADKMFAAWTFHPISGQAATPKFGHGLGVGDVDGDKKLDIITADGWFQQPASLSGDPMWKFHKVLFTPSGGADMFAYDVDGDGDNDVITSLAAHDFGLAWFEQRRDGDKIQFHQHLIMGTKREENRYGVLFTELHSVALADMDGDGLLDIVTGKTYWSHHNQSPLWDAGAVVYWFKLVRNKEGVDWIPHQADGESGIGRQVVVTDLNGDKLPDIVVGGMKGCFALTHETKTVDEAAWKQAQPTPVANYRPTPPSLVPAERPAKPKPKSVSGALEGEKLKVVKVTGTAKPQNMTSFAGSWSGGQQLFWMGAKPGGRLELEFNVDSAGTYAIETMVTKARDYGIVQFAIDGEKLGAPVDLFHSTSVVAALQKLGERELKAGAHTLAVEIVGANDAAVKAYMFGLDYLKLTPTEKK